jgi:DNA-binding GntR family transcriptional regulator
MSSSKSETPSIRASSEVETSDDAKPSAVQRVVDVVLSRIRSGEYAPGQIIVARDLMAELDLSKAPVREGIHVLVGEGVVELLQNRSARIRKLSTKDLLDFVEVWAAVGGVNVRLAAEHVGDNDHRRRVAEASKRIQRTGQNRVPYEFFMAVANFHSVLADLSDNDYIRSIINRAHFAHFHRHIERILPGAYWQKHLDAFQQIADAVLAGNGEAAERVYRRHMSWVLETMRQSLSTPVAFEAEG